MESKSEEINVLDILNFVVTNRKRFMLAAIVAVLVAVLHKIVTPSVYETKVAFVNQTSSDDSKLGGGLSSLAGMAGISLGGGEEQIKPKAYPNILYSSIFLRKVCEAQLETTNSSEVLLLEYLKKHRKKTIWERITALLKSELPSNTLQIDENGNLIQDKNYRKAKQYLERILSIKYDNKTGISTIKVAGDDPKLIVELANFAYNYLHDYLLENQTKSERRKLDFIVKELNSAKENFAVSQSNLASFRDRNTNIISALSRTQEQTLEAEFNVAFNIYNSLMMQREESRIKLEEKNPKFDLVEVAVVPDDPSAPRLSKLLLLYLFVSQFLVATMILTIKFIGHYKKHFGI